VDLALAALAPIAVATLLWSSGCGSNHDGGGKDAKIMAKPLAVFKHDDLKQTVVLPTLDTPLPPSKSAIWCSSFQIAWNHFKTDVVRGPVRLVGAQEVADRLNTAKQSDKDLVPGSFFADAGFIRDGIQERIRQGMGKQFPGVALPDFPDDPRQAVAFAYLQAEVTYQFRYINNKEALVFKDSAGKETKVRSFGIPSYKEHSGLDTYRAQVQILFQEGDEFALDLSRKTTPNQIVVARVQRRDTLEAVLKDLADKQARAAKKDQQPTFSGADTLLIPNMHWLVHWRFQELEKKDLVDREEEYIKYAWQEVQFTLDRKGARLKSKSWVEGDWVDGDPSYPFHCDRPFLLYIKKRDAEHPFFVMWVDNAELLQQF
jgi:hypothetical protein